MAEHFIGEIRFFPYKWAPRGWALCDGDILPIAENQALYSLLGNTFGGDGRTNFALPDLRGRTPIHTSTASPRGTAGGEEAVALTTNEIPAHTHSVAASKTVGTVSSFENARFAGASDSANIYAETKAPAALNPASVSATGDSQAHPNCQPSLVGNFCIATEGIYPIRQ